MSDYEFFNRMINKIDKDYGYDIANEFQRLFIKKENENIELQDRIYKAIEYIKENFSNLDGEIWHEEMSKILKILGDKHFYTCELCKEEKEDVIPRNNPYMLKINDEILKQYLCKDCYDKLWDNIYEE